jgi:hypothetical protein
MTPTVSNTPDEAELAVCFGDLRRIDAEAARSGVDESAGYGRAHQTLRRALTPAVAAGLARCVRCGELIEAGAPWDLGHDDLDRSITRCPEHRRCNRSTVVSQR